MSGNVSNAMLTQFIPLLVQSRLPQVVNINELIFQNNSVDQVKTKNFILGNDTWANSITEPPLITIHKAEAIHLMFNTTCG